MGGVGVLHILALRDFYFFFLLKCDLQNQFALSGKLIEKCVEPNFTNFDTILLYEIEVWQRYIIYTIVKTAEPHQAALELNCYVIWLRSKWGLKLTYFLNFAIYFLLVQLRVKWRLKRRAVVYFHSQPFSNRLNSRVVY